jgi:hypothetical protein
MNANGSSNQLDACWDIVLPYLGAPKSSGGEKIPFRVSLIVDDLKQGKGKDVDAESVAQALREAVVVTLSDGAGYSTDKTTGEVVYLLPGPDARSKVIAGLRARSWRHHLKFFWEERAFPCLCIC